MSKKSELKKKFDEFIAGLFSSNEDTHEVEFASQKLEDGTIISYENLNVGTDVFVQQTDGNLTPLADGEYKVEEGTLVVASGKVAEVKVEEPASPVEPVPAQEQAKEETKMAEIVIDQPLPDGIYFAPDGKQLTVIAGKVTDISEVDMKKDIKMSAEEQVNLKDELKKEVEKEYNEKLEAHKKETIEKLEELAKLSRESKVKNAPIEVKPEIKTVKDIMMSELEETWNKKK